MENGGNEFFETAVKILGNKDEKQAAEQRNALCEEPENEKKEKISSYSIADMENQATHLCEELNSSTFDVEAWLKEVSEFAEDKNNRLIYSKVSDYVFVLAQRDQMMGNLEDVRDAMSGPAAKQYSLNARKMIFKLYDHVNLAIRQKDIFLKKDEERKKEIEKVVKPEVEIKSAEITKEMTTQLVSLVAIFTALSFIVFGGISSLNGIFSSLQLVMKERSTVLPTLIVTDAWALCLMNLLFGFMYFVLRITRIPKPVDENAKNLVQRYPVVFFCDYVLLLLMAVLCGMWFAECNGIGVNVFKVVVENSTASFLGMFGAIFLLFLIFCCSGMFLISFETKIGKN